MKRWIGFILHLAMIVILTSFVSYTTPKKVDYKIPNSLKTRINVETLVLEEPLEIQEDDLVTPPFLGNAYNGFKEALAFKESQGRYDVINTLGYLGKYQFGVGTLKLLGVNDSRNFLNDPVLQEKVFETNVARNKWILRRYIKLYNGKRIRGTVITESGILAAAHLAGAGNVKKYLRSYGKNDVADAYGSSISYYMRKFSGFDICSIEQKRNAKI
ncbi:hypothetical protein [Flagellimonas algicola]|uniref:Peptidoglycan-binding protein LysM n=1 Tax=Flagellimonas algicola TaxID=2583815 RepID=A0ABY2WPC0_9FLAO|nr:hypothetical protein [Allomuricauda algicola]TMU56833.1 hypothetical protein FGG15_04615 [Allomuricauda algicola]